WRGCSRPRGATGMTRTGYIRPDGRTIRAAGWRPSVRRRASRMAASESVLLAATHPHHSTWFRTDMTPVPLRPHPFAGMLRSFIAGPYSPAWEIGHAGFHQGDYP